MVRGWKGDGMGIDRGWKWHGNWLKGNGKGLERGWKEDGKGMRESCL